MLLSAWRSWRAKTKLMAPVGKLQPGEFLARNLHDPELREAWLHGPRLEPYEGLAEIWDAHSAPHLPDYPSFLVALARKSGRELASILDLACGTGTLTVRLAEVAGEVVGLDASEAMLARARRRNDNRSGIRYALGDFRRFDLGRPFDAVTCASNSLNYLDDLSELTAVFSGVAKHLRPGGWFVFDALSEFGMRHLSGHFFYAEVNGEKFALRFGYDAVNRREETHVILANGVETHRRIPIDPIEVALAANRSGLSLDDYFCSPLISGSRYGAQLYFFVLTKSVR